VAVLFADGVEANHAGVGGEKWWGEPYSTAKQALQHQPSR
jgi:hypothetical protein